MSLFRLLLPMKTNRSATTFSPSCDRSCGSRVLGAQVRAYLRLASCAALALVFLGKISIARELPLNSDRWLRVKQIQGGVTYDSNNQLRPARIGDRLQATGQGLRTGKRSSAVLDIDDGISSVRVTENTTLRVSSLKTLPSGGKVTILSVTQGQIKLQLRKFTNSQSRLEVQTPTGIAGVRGTVFGVGVNPNGKTTAATREGSVALSAQGKTVVVDAGYGSLIMPGEAPTPPQPFVENVTLNVQQLSRVGNNQIRLVAEIDPLNQVLLNEQLIDTGRTGQLNTTIAIVDRQPLQAIVRSPLGKEQVYELVVP